MKTQTNSKQSGFSLIEVLVGMVILGIMVSSVYSFLNGQNKASVISADTSKAMLYGKKTLDSLRMGDYAKIVTDCDTVNSRYVRTWHTSTDLINHFKTVELVVSWPTAKTEHSMTFNTIVADDVYKVMK